MVIDGVRRRVPVNDRCFVVLVASRRARVQMQERRGGRAELHTETDEQDEAEPLHLHSIVADLSRRVKEPTSRVRPPRRRTRQRPDASSCRATQEIR